MKYCKKCGVLYSSVLERCPKCNPALEAGMEAEKASAPEAAKNVKRRQWIAILFGIPALIFFLYFVISELNTLS